MAKNLFKSYTYNFDKNEKKIIATFCKQALKQMTTDDKFFREVRVFNSILEKINAGEEEVKLTKEESTKLSLQLNENLKHLKKQMDNTWFLKKWFMKSVYYQYYNIVENHFSK